MKTANASRENGFVSVPAHLKDHKQFKREHKWILSQQDIYYFSRNQLGN